MHTGRAHAHGVVCHRCTWGVGASAGVADCGELKVTRGRLSAGFSVVPRVALVVCAPVAAAAVGASAAGAVASPAGSFGLAALRERQPRLFFDLAAGLHPCRLQPAI